MKFLGPLRVFYDGPLEAEAYYASLARVRIGYLQAIRADFHAAPITSLYEFPNGVVIRSILTGDTATAFIAVPTSKGSAKRRFVTYPGFIIGMFPTSEPTRLAIKPIVKKGGKGYIELNPSIEPDYLVTQVSKIDIQERNAQGNIVREVKGTGVARGADNEYIFSEYMPMSGAFPGKLVSGTTPPQYNPKGKVVYIPVCGKGHPQVLDFVPQPAPAPPRRQYTEETLFGGRNMQCTLNVPGILYEREFY